MGIIILVCIRPDCDLSYHSKVAMALLGRHDLHGAPPISVCDMVRPVLLAWNDFDTLNHGGERNETCDLSTRPPTEQATGSASPILSPSFLEVCVWIVCVMP